MMARTGGIASNVAKRKASTAHDSQEGDEMGDRGQSNDATADERFAALKDNEEVINDLLAETEGGAVKETKPTFDPEGHTGLVMQYMHLAWWCRRIEGSNAFVVFIMVIIVLASVLVGVNMYETDSFGNQLLSRTAMGVLGSIETIILIIFWFEIALKFIGTGIKPWVFFTVGWYAPRTTVVPFVELNPCKHERFAATSRCCP